MSGRDTRLADQTLAAQYSFADIHEGNPWHNKVAAKVANMEGTQQKLTFFETSRLMARQGESYAVSTEFTEMIQHAAEDLVFQWTEGDTDPEVLLPYDVPSRAGFVHFAHHVRLPVVSLDEDGYDFNMGALGFMWAMNDPDNPQAIAFIPFASKDLWREHNEDGWGDLLRNYGSPPEYMAHDYCGWYFGKPWRVDPTSPLGQGAKTVVQEDGTEVRLFNPSAAADRAILWSFFRLVSQRIPRIERMHPSRQTKRRMARKPDLMTAQPEDGAVQVYTLRKEQGAEGDRLEGEAETNWSHRWIVKPGWQKRRVAVRDAEGKITGSTRGTEGTDWIYRRVYIAPYIKGPEDKPLILKDAVGILRR